MLDCGFFLIIAAKNGHLKLVLTVLSVTPSITKGLN